MKVAVFACLLLFSGCAVPVVKLQDSDVSRYAVIEIDLEAWLGDNMKGEFAHVSFIDGIWENKYPNKKAGRLSPGGPLVKYVLIEPGDHELTIAYNRNTLGVAGRLLWSGAVTEKVSLKAGRYFARYSVDGNFVTLWLEDARGIPVSEKRRSVIGEATPQTPVVIPVIIPK